MHIISFDFTSPSASISSDKMSIKPMHDCTLDASGQTITISYSIRTSGVKVRLITQQKSHTLDGVSDSFRKEIIFEPASTGTKKDFTLVATATLGNSTATAELEIKYS